MKFTLSDLVAEYACKGGYFSLDGSKRFHRRVAAMAKALGTTTTALFGVIRERSGVES